MKWYYYDEIAIICYLKNNKLSAHMRHFNLSSLRSTRASKMKALTSQLKNNVETWALLGQLMYGSLFLIGEVIDPLDEVEGYYK